MPSSEILRRVALVKTDVLEERSVSIIKLIGIGERGATLAVTSNRCMLRRNSLRLLVTANVPSSLILFTLMMPP
jgi:hypothetical protein